MLKRLVHTKSLAACVAGSFTFFNCAERPICCDEKKMSSRIDHTALKPTTLKKDIDTLCEEAMTHQFAAVCVPPYFVKESREKLGSSDVKTATVIGFPFGYSSVKAKRAEIREGIRNGCDEFDVVANIAAIKNHEWGVLIDEIYALLPLVRKHNKVIKVIIESGVLTEEEIIKCCEIYGQAGIDYLKTSTGYAEKGASVATVRLFRKHLPLSVRIKASGGIRDYTKALAMVEAGADRIGCSSGVAIAAGEKQSGGDISNTVADTKGEY